MRRITALILCVFIFAGIFPSYADEAYSIKILSRTVDGERAVIAGQVLPAASVPLSFKVYEGETLCSEGDAQPDASGAFSFDFPVDSESELRHTYRYVISEKPVPDSINEYYSDDFGTRKSYIKYGAADSGTGNPAPSVKIGGGGDNRLLYSTSRKSSGIYAVSADVMIPSGVNRLLFAVTNSAGNSGKNNGDINKMTDACSYSALQVLADNDGNIKLDYAFDKQLQTEKRTAVIGTYTPGEWFSFRAEMDFDTLELKAFLNGEPVLENESMYIFAQQDYNRMFDTSYPSGGEYFIDNLKIEEITRTPKKGIPDFEGELVCYGAQDYKDALSAVNGAENADDFKKALSVYADVFGIDYSLFDGMSDSAKLMIFMTLSQQSFKSVQEFVKSYSPVCAAAGILDADEQELAEAIKENAAALSFAPDEDFYTDSCVIRSAALSRRGISDIEQIKDMLGDALIMHRLRNATDAVLSDTEKYFPKFGCYAVYSKSKAVIKEQLVSAARSFSFDSEKTVADNMALWADYMNKAFAAANAAASEYVTEISETVVSGREISISGNVVPAVKYDFSLTVSCDGETAVNQNFSTESDGKFDLKCTVPESAEDKLYTVSILPVHPLPQITTYLDDDFSDSSVSYVKKDAVMSDTVGNAAPSVKLIKNAEFSRPRLLYRAGEVKSLTSGIVHVTADLMKPDMMASSKLFSVTDDSGNYAALTLAAGGYGDFNLKYRDTDNNDTTITLLDKYEPNKWYTVDYAIDMASKEVTVSINGDERAAIKIGSSISDFARVLDCEGGGDAANPAVCYVDNVKCYRDSAQREKIADKYFNVNVPGTKRVKEALDALNGASADEFLNVVQQYNDVFAADFSVLEGISSKDAIPSGLAGETYTSAAQVRSAFYAQTALVRMKEAQPGGRSEILYNNKAWFGIDMDAEIAKNTLLSDLLDKNIASFTKHGQLAEFSENLILLARIKAATQLTAYTIIDKYADVLKDFGLSSGYFAKGEAVRRSCAAAAIAKVSESSDPKVLLKEAMAAVNAALDNSDKNTPSPGGSVGGGGGGGGGTSSGGYTAPITPDTAQSSEKPRFPDVDNTHWAFEAVNYLAEKGIVNGRENGEFCPDLPVLREEFVKLIADCLDTEIKPCEHSFSDVVPGIWYEPYVAFAYEKGIVKGLPDGSFGVGTTVTRQDAAVMIYRCAESLNAGISPVRGQSAFSDVSEISSYALEAAEYLYKCGILNGTDGGRFAPKDTLTRAEAAKLLYETVRR